MILLVILLFQPLPKFGTTSGYSTWNKLEAFQIARHVLRDTFCNELALMSKTWFSLLSKDFRRSCSWVKLLNDFLICPLRVRINFACSLFTLLTTTDASGSRSAVLHRFSTAFSLNVLCNWRFVCAFWACN